MYDTNDSNAPAVINFGPDYGLLPWRVSCSHPTCCNHITGERDRESALARARKHLETEHEGAGSFVEVDYR